MKSPMGVEILPVLVRLIIFLVGHSLIWVRHSRICPLALYRIPGIPLYASPMPFLFLIG